MTVVGPVIGVDTILFVKIDLADQTFQDCVVHVFRINDELLLMSLLLLILLFMLLIYVLHMPVLIR